MAAGSDSVNGNGTAVADATGANPVAVVLAGVNPADADTAGANPADADTAGVNPADVVAAAGTKIDDAVDAGANAAIVVAGIDEEPIEELPKLNAGTVAVGRAVVVVVATATAG